MHVDSILSDDAFRRQAARDGITHLSTGVAIVQGHQVLMVRRARAKGDFMAGNFELPGGGVEPGEDLETSARREVKEETGLTVREVVRRFEGFDYSTDRKPKVRQLNFLVEVTPGEVLLDPREHDAYTWVDATNLAAVTTSASTRHSVEVALRIASKRNLAISS